MFSSNTNSPKVTVVILNWNSWLNTIECLESVLKSDYSNFDIIIVDNHSTDQSISKIETWARGALTERISTNFPELIYPLVNKPIDLMTFQIQKRKFYDEKIIDTKPKILLLCNDENAGFAVANNISINLSYTIYQSQYVFLLNNDTVISANTISEVISNMQQDPSIGAAQATIYYYHQPQKIANAGGVILPWGQTKYYKKIRQAKIHEVNFINGCALCIRREIIKKYGALSEDFFHGEEDFELSMRLRRLKIKKVCVTKAKVYHKIGISSNELLKQKISKKVLLFAVNRIVDMKKYLSPKIWRVWLEFSLCYFFLLMLIRYRLSIKEVWKTIYSARKISMPIHKVDKRIVQSIVSEV